MLVHSAHNVCALHIWSLWTFTQYSGPNTIKRYTVNQSPGLLAPGLTISFVHVEWAEKVDMLGLEHTKGMAFGGMWPVRSQETVCPEGASSDSNILMSLPWSLKYWVLAFRLCTGALTFQQDVLVLCDQSLYWLLDYHKYWQNQNTVSGHVQGSVLWTKELSKLKY